VESKFSLNNSETHETAVNYFDKTFSELGLTRERNLVFKILVGSDDFIRQKVYLLRLMPVCVGLIMLAAYFCYPANHKWSIMCIDKSGLA
jgi:hypothetical protein